MNDRVEAIKRIAKEIVAHNIKGKEIAAAIHAEMFAKPVKKKVTDNKVRDKKNTR